MSGIHQLMLSGHQIKHSWEEIVPVSGSEPSGDRGGAVFVTDGTDFYLYGGKPRFGGQLNDLWKFSMSSRTWTQLSSNVSGSPTGYSYPYGFINSAGTHFYLDSITAGFQASGAGYEITLSTPTATAITGQSGSFAAFTSAVDRSTDTVYSSYRSFFSIYNQYKCLLSGSTVTNTTQGLASPGSFNFRSSFAYCPNNNSIYSVSDGATSGNWTLSTNSMIKYDITSNVDWARETGITNNVGGITIQDYPIQIIWSQAQNVFYIFTSTNIDQIEHVFTYDPATKVFAPVAVSGTPAPYYLLSHAAGGFGHDSVGLTRGEMGKVCVRSDGIYFIVAASDNTLTNSRIWRLRFNY